MKILVNVSLLVLLVAGVMASSSQSDTATVQIPKGAAPTIDGAISDAEWQGALKQELVSGGEVRFLQDGTHLYVGMSGGGPAWGHVYVFDGAEVKIIHASAALGTAIYKDSGNNQWQPTQKYTWELRAPDQTPEKKAAFLAKNAWLANTVNNKPQLEFQVALKLLHNDKARLAVAYISNPTAPRYWPKTLNDDTLKQDLVIGNTPADLKFNFANWVKVKF